MADGGCRMGLVVLSDPHLQFGAFRVPDLAFEVVSLAGDIAVPASKVPFWACRTTNFAEATPKRLRDHSFLAFSISRTHAWIVAR